MPAREFVEWGWRGSNEMKITSAMAIVEHKRKWALMNKMESGQVERTSVWRYGHEHCIVVYTAEQEQDDRQRQADM